MFGGQRLHRVGDRSEARELHEFPEDRVIVTGAPRFDSFFELAPRLSRENFHVPLGLDPGKPTLFYVCSSLLVSADELSFVRAWLAAIRGSAGSLRNCNIIVRPHPDIELLGEKHESQEVHFPSMRGAKGFVSRPFDDSSAIVLKTSDRARQGFFECLFHSAAVVGLNTSAQLEAGILGPPVLTILAPEFAAGQQGTLHFSYLLKEQGGFVDVAPDFDTHRRQLGAAVRGDYDPPAIRSFIEQFLRARGIDRPATPHMVHAIEQFAQSHRDTHSEVTETHS